MVEDQGQTVRENEGIRVKELETCLLCRNKGTILYQGLRDRLFGAPGTWSLMHCSKCDLVWLNPHPIADDICKLYTNSLTHQLTEYSQKRLAKELVLGAMKR